MRHELQSPPRTIMEVFKMLPEGTLAEIIEGTLYMSPAPTTNHQSILLEISAQLLGLQKSKGGRVFTSPTDVFLDETLNAVQPDVIVVLNGNLQTVHSDAIHGVPDLVVEILSPGNSSHDTVRKKALYEKFGVREYWIVNPDTKESVGYILKDKNYIECSRHLSKIHSPLLNAEIQF